MHCVHAGSGEIWVVWDRGIPMQGVCISHPVQALQARQNSQGKAEAQLSLVKAQEKSGWFPPLVLPVNYLKQNSALLSETILLELSAGQKVPMWPGSLDGEHR